MNRIPPAAVLMVAMMAAVFAVAQPRKKDAPTAGAVTINAMAEDTARIEGEKRFRANCGRCHQSPHKFPARMLVTIERHMRVRALVTDEDMHLIIHYLTE